MLDVILAKMGHVYTTKDEQLYNYGKKLNQIVKYNIDYNSEEILNYVCTSFCQWFMEHVSLTEEQQHIVQKLIKNINK